MLVGWLFWVLVITTVITNTNNFHIIKEHHAEIFIHL